MIITKQLAFVWAWIGKNLKNEPNDFDDMYNVGFVLSCFEDGFNLLSVDHHKLSDPDTSLNHIRALPESISMLGDDLNDFTHEHLELLSRA